MVHYPECWLNANGDARLASNPRAKFVDPDLDPNAPHGRVISLKL